MLSNTRFPVAIHVLCALAHHDRVLDSATLAASTGTSASFLRTLLGELRDAGLVTTRRGPGGGSGLARPARQITLHDVFRATEDPGALTPHPLDPDPDDPVARAMPALLADLDGRLVDAMAAALVRTTLDELVAGHLDGG